MPRPKKNERVDTRAAAQKIALELFTTKGYDATSLREIAEALGVSKAALYYHFESKEEILRSLVATRGDEAKELAAWARAQDPSPDLAERTILRWVDGATADKLHGIRFMLANPTIAREMRGEARKIGDGLEALAALVTPKKADGETRLLIRMAFLSINAAVMAAAGSKCTDDEIIAAARASARATLAAIRVRVS